MIILGLTGSIGMGKTTIANIFSYLSVPVFDSDYEVHKLYKDPKIISLISSHFPESYNKKDKSIDRNILSSMIFTDSINPIDLYDVEEKKKLLESIIHPLIRNKQNDFIKKHILLGNKYVLIDIPLLFETGSENRFDYIITATAPFFIQKQRVLSRSGMTEEKFYKILDSQISNEEKIRKSDFIIKTGASRALITKEIKSILNKLKTTNYHKCG